MPTSLRYSAKIKCAKSNPTVRICGDFLSQSVINFHIFEWSYKQNSLTTTWNPLSKFCVRMATESELFPDTSSCSKWKFNKLNFPVMRLDNLATTWSSSSQARRKAANFLSEVLIRLPVNGLLEEGFLFIISHLRPPHTPIIPTTHTHTYTPTFPKEYVFSADAPTLWESYIQEY